MKLLIASGGNLFTTSS